MKASHALRRFLLSSLALASASSALAQTTYFWDADGGDTTATGGSGTWNTGSSLWRSGTDTGTLSQWPNTNPAVDYAQFAGTAGTVTLNSDSENITVNRIIFGTTGYEIKGPVSGTATLNLSGTSPQINAGTSISATISANISGSTGFSKTGAGTLTLKGTNTYSGTTTVSGGSITVEGSHSGGGWTIGTSAAATSLTFAAGSTISMTSGDISTTAGGGSGGRSIVVNGSVTSSSTSNITIGGRNSMSINNGGSWAMQGGTLSISGGNSGYSVNFNVNAGGSFTYSGSNSIIVAKPTQTNNFNANLNLRGTFTTTRGFINTGAGGGTGTSNIIFDGGTLKISNDITSIFTQDTQPFNISMGTGGGTIDTNGFNTATSLGITGAGGLSKASAGTLTLSGTNTYTGGTNVLGGDLNTTQASALASYSTAGKVVINGGTLGVRVGGSGWTTGEVDTMLTNATKTSGALGIDTTNGSLTQWTAFTTSNLGSSLGLDKLGANTLTLDQTNTYTGGTSVLGGILNTTQASALASYDTAGKVVINGGTLGVQVGGSGWTTGEVDTMLTNATKTSGALGIDTTNGSITQWTAFTTTNLGSSLGLNKLGANSLTLDQTNTYTGATTVSAGTLYVTGTLSNSAVTVGANGTIASNGIAGTLGNGLTIQEGGNLDLTGATIGLNSTGILSLTGGSLTLGNLTFQDLVGWDWLNAEEGTYELIAGTFSINWGNTAYLSEETAYDFGNGKLGYFTSGSLNVVIVPEPGTALLGGLGLLALLLRRRTA